MSEQAAKKVCPSCGAEASVAHRFCPSCGTNLDEVPAGGSEDPLVGRIVASKYRLKRLLGEGAMGRVYEAEQIPLGKSFAVKLLSPHLMHDEASRARFAREAHNAANLNHPNCVSVMDYGQSSDGLAYIIMEFIEGRDLETVIRSDFPLPRPRMVDLVLQILAALTEAHGLGILHRDLKPENILVQRLRTHGELAKVVDFGIAKLMDNAPGGSGPRLTNQAMVCGTPEYMSPEQARGAELDGRSDLYAVGCILYQMLTGSPPFESDSAVEILHRHLHEQPLPPSKLMGTSPDAIEAVCMKALAKDPNERYANALEFREALVRAANEQAPPSRACPSCGAQVTGRERFCSECGTSLAPTATRAASGASRHPTRRSGLNLQATTTGSRTAELLVRNFPPPLVGRDELMEQARVILSHPRPELSALALQGPAGAGKTRMVDEIAAMAEHLGWRVFYMGADPSPARTPLWPIRMMVGQLLGLDPRTCTTEDLERAANLRGVGFEELPGLAELVQVEGPAHALEYQVRKRECRAAAIQAMVSGGMEHPLLLAFDDVHLYDDASRAILRKLARWTCDAPVQIVFASGESDTSWLGIPARPLAPLGPADLERLCQRVSVDAQPTSELPVTLAAGGSPSPLLVELRLRLLAAGETFDPAADEDTLTRARLATLAPLERGLLECAAVLGERCSESALVKLLQHAQAPSESEIDQALAQLHVGGFLVVTGHGERAFAHARLRPVVEADMAGDRKAALHAAAASLVAQAGDRLSQPQQAVHRLLSGDTSAWSDLLEAADFAERSFDDTGAADFLEAAFDLLGRDPGATPSDRARVLARVGHLSVARPRLEHLLAAVDAELKHDALPPRWRAELLLTHARLTSRLGHAEDALAAHQKALGPFIASGDLQQVLTTYSEMGQTLVRLGNWERALKELREGLDLCTLGMGPRAEIDLPLWRYLLGVSSTLRAAGRLQEARKWCEDALYQAERLDDRLGILRVHAQMAWLVRELHQNLLAENHLARALESARHFGDRLSTAELLLQRMRTRAARGEVADAVRLCTEALRLAQAVDWRAGVQHAERALSRLRASTPA